MRGIVAGLLVACAACVVGGKDTYPLVPSRFHDYWQPTSSASGAGAVDQFGQYYKGVRESSGGEGWGWAVGLQGGGAFGDVHGVRARGLALTARAQLSWILSSHLGVAASALYAQQDLEPDGGAATLAFSAKGAEARVLFAPVDLFVLEAGLAAHRGSLAWTPKGGRAETGGVTGGDLVVGAGYTVNYVGLASLLGLEARFTRTTSTMLGGVDTGVASTAVLGKVMLSF